MRAYDGEIITRNNTTEAARMIVPSFWAEARRQIRQGKRQITVRRWDWSDTSEADAQAMADARADEALALAQTDNTVERRERKVAYNGAQGVPIREEVLDTRAADFAACEWIESVGSGAVHISVQPVVDLHDRVSQALQTGKPLA